MKGKYLLVGVFVMAFLIGGVIITLANTSELPTNLVGRPFRTITIPGTIQAVNFNLGPSKIAYYWNQIGEGNYQSYRPGSEVYIFKEGTTTFIESTAEKSGPFVGYGKDYVNYTFYVSESGWFQVVYKARTVDSKSPGQIVTLIDNVQKGFSPQISISTNWSDIIIPQNIFLSKGEHVLTVVFRTGNIQLSSIIFERIKNIDIIKPIPILFKNSVSFVANAVVTLSPFNADPTGHNDSTKAIQKAINYVYSMGGGIVYIPAGIYKISGHLQIPEGVTLRGQWKDPLKFSDSNEETILEAFAGRNEENGNPFIEFTGVNSTVRDICIYYPEQNPEKLTPYSYTIGQAENSESLFSLNVMDVTLYNSYNGIKITNGSESNISNIYGTVIKNGISLGGDEEYSYLLNVNFTPTIWINFKMSKYKFTDEIKDFLSNYIRQNLIGIILRRNDALTVNNVKIDVSKIGIYLEQGSSTGFYGPIMDTNTSINAQGYNRFVGYVNTNELKNSTITYYKYPPEISLPSTNIIILSPSVEATNDSLRIQFALNKVASEDDGFVYLSPGSYNLYTNLYIPENVELLGAYDAPHGSEQMDVTILNAYISPTSSKESTSATALISLYRNSGVKGITIYYPNQNPESVKPFPFTFRGLGDNIRIEYVDVVNPYNLIDFSKFPCNNFILNGIVASVLNDGIVIGSGTNGGWMERVLIDFGTYFQSNHIGSPFLYGISSLMQYTLSHSKPFIFENCSKIQGLGLGTFNVKTSFTFKNTSSGEGPQDIWIYSPGADTTNGPGYLIESGDNINLVGLQGGSTQPSNERFLQTTKYFNGIVNIYGALLWATNKNPLIISGKVNIYSESKEEKTNISKKLTTFATSVSYVVGKNNNTINIVLGGGKLLDSRYHIANVDGKESIIFDENPYDPEGYSMLYMKPTLTEKATTLYLVITYYDYPSGLNLTAEYNSSIRTPETVNGKYAPVNNIVKTSGERKWKTTIFKLTNVLFEGTEKTGWAAAYNEPYGADFRIKGMPGLAISKIVLTDNVNL